MEALSFADYWAILKRRQKLFLTITSIVFALSFVFALNWSNYRAEATVEIAQPDIDTATTSPNEVTSIADLRISRLQQKVLSIGSLVDVIRKHNLYPNKQKKQTLAAIAKIMHKKIRISLIGSELANPASAQKASARQLSAIAFKLSFDYHNPILVQQATNTLVNHFLEEDSKDHKTQTEQTSSFLSNQIKILGKSLVDQEKQIAIFRIENGDTSTAAQTFNKQAAASNSMRLQNIENQITTNIGTQGTLRAQLATTNPYSRTMADGQILTTPSIQLKGLESEYATLTAKYSNTHPDVIKIKRQIAALKPLVKSSNNHAMLEAKITDTQARLKASVRTNGNQHPDIRKLNNRLISYKEELASLPEDSNNNLIKQDADNPIYLQTVLHLRTLQEQRKSLITQRSTLQKEQKKFSIAITNNPISKQKFSALSRDYENILARYREIKEKKLQADMNKEIAKDRTGDRLLLTNPPELPTKTQPGRILFILAGLVLSFGAGLLAVIISQLLSNSVIGPRHLAALTGIEALICIPHISTESEKNKNAKWKKLIKAITTKLGMRKNNYG